MDFFDFGFGGFFAGNHFIHDGKIIRIRAAGYQAVFKFGFFAVEFFDGFGERGAPGPAGVHQRAVQIKKYQLFHFFASPCLLTMPVTI